MMDDRIKIPGNLEGGSQISERSDSFQNRCGWLVAEPPGSRRARYFWPEFLPSGQREGTQYLYEDGARARSSGF